MREVGTGAPRRLGCPVEARTQRLEHRDGLFTAGGREEGLCTGSSASGIGTACCLLVDGKRRCAFLATSFSCARPSEAA